MENEQLKIITSPPHPNSQNTSSFLDDFEECEVSDKSASNHSQHLSPPTKQKNPNNSSKKSLFHPSAKLKKNTSRNSSRILKSNSFLVNSRSMNKGKPQPKEDKEGLKVKNFTSFLKNIFKPDLIIEEESDRVLFDDASLYQHLFFIFAPQIEETISKMKLTRNKEEFVLKTVVDINAKCQAIQDLRKQIFTLENILISFQFLESNQSMWSSFYFDFVCFCVQLDYLFLCICIILYYFLILVCLNEIMN